MGRCEGHDRGVWKSREPGNREQKYRCAGDLDHDGKSLHLRKAPSHQSKAWIRQSIMRCPPNAACPSAKTKKFQTMMAASCHLVGSRVCFIYMTPCASRGKRHTQKVTGVLMLTTTDGSEPLDHRANSAVAINLVAKFETVFRFRVGQLRKQSQHGGLQATVPDHILLNGPAWALICDD